MKKLASFGVLGVVLCALPALAAPASSTTSSHASYAAPAASSGTPDTIAGGLGDYDFDKGGNRNTADYRLEYQWGMSVLPKFDNELGYLDRYFQIHPVLGFEGDGNGMTYFNGGLNIDVPVVSKIVFTWGEDIGWYGHGDDHQTLGSPFEVRSQLELGWMFDNNMRLSAYLSHLSNAGTGDHDPGAEILGAYVKMPVGWLAK